MRHGVPGYMNLEAVLQGAATNYTTSAHVHPVPTPTARDIHLPITSGRTSAHVADMSAVYSVNQL